MEALKAQWKLWSARFDALARRERLLVAGAVVLGGLYLGLMFWVEPMFARAKRFASQSESQASELSGLQAQIVSLGQQVARDPNEALRAELARVDAQLAALEIRLSEFDASLVPPQRIPALLDSLIRKTPGVRLVGFKTLPVEGLLAARRKSAPASNAPTSNTPASNGATGSVPEASAMDVYKHGFELKLRGNYLALLAYLQTLEAEPQRLLWQRAQLQVPAYPESELTLTVLTLSMDRHWLEL